MIASTIIDVPGTSQVVKECHVTYSNEAKMKYLGDSQPKQNENTISEKIKIQEAVEKIENAETNESEESKQAKSKTDKSKKKETENEE